MNKKSEKSKNVYPDLSGYITQGIYNDLDDNKNLFYEYSRQGGLNE